MNDFMRTAIAYFFLFLLISSCDEKPDSRTFEESNSQNQVIEAVIDTSDLYMLPEDIGGTQSAFPLATVKARISTALANDSLDTEVETG